ncbi:transcription factor GTE8-like isoform X2 [Magnolia sinica]|nr:transcription factor GTE8-like isoform X2 [Magnolia sinica]XP_058093849.1 transcription factor GTE8-like isoform X2 [Magnolia sinica]XP_058093850.1 transcription factor GTE8-like isoform X2 [Magnolia sinica]
MAPTVVLEYTQQKESKKPLKDFAVTMMGKTLSRGSYSSSFMPEQLAVETVGESEGFGSSCRVDTEMTASEDSCGPKRKSMSLNGNRCDVFNIPLQVLSLSKMSRSERKELKVKLKAELEQVCVLKNKIFSMCLEGISVSSSSVIRNCNDGQKMSVTENLQFSLDLASEKGKKQGSVIQNAPILKCSLSDQFESVNQSGPSSKKDVTLMKQCEMLLKRLMSHQFGWVFNSPVDVVKLNLPDYFTVIKNPMDLGTIKSKMASLAYSSPLGFAADVRLTFSNAMTYNPPGNYAHNMADTLSKFFEMRWKSIEKKIPVSSSQLVPAKLAVSREALIANPLTQSKKRKESSSTNHKLKMETESMKRAKTKAHKLSISRDIESLQLQGDIPKHIVDILRRHRCDADQTSEEEMEVDFDVMNDDTLCKLRKLLDDYLQEKHTNQLLNESGLSNSSVQPCKGNDPSNEDVDIGGNDPPVSSYPPLEIEKDTTLRSVKCNSSSHSSRDSDSDSGSSGSEFDGAKVTSPAKPVKEIEGSGATLDQEKSDILDPYDGSASGSDQVEQNPQPKPVSAGVDCHQEGENAPSGRRVSPEKLYRAALLRNRFADTILKAREKTLGQGEKGDPEKVRREREELEKQRREEKARLQAEAKAAEDARRRANAEAAAEAKRKRELEREAARQALQKMEKTVEIDESCQFLKDLEMLGSAPIELPPSFADEMSPHRSLDVMGSFKLSGSNPLEQLGLFMKVDDEEEEGDPVNVPLHDVEEGEI